MFVREVLPSNDYEGITGRFIYGELRLSRLNQICNFGRLSFVAFLGISLVEFFEGNFAWLASGTAYIVVILTAMQLGLATRPLADNDAFHSASYGFAVFSILGPLAATGLFILIYSFLFVYWWVASATYKKRRFRELHIMPDTKAMPYQAQV